MAEDTDFLDVFFGEMEFEEGIPLVSEGTVTLDFLIGEVERTSDFRLVLERLRLGSVLTVS